MVVIRLARRGAKKAPFYDIVVTDKRNSRDGKFVEKLGYYNPIAKETKASQLNIRMERFDYWVKTGAQPSARVESLVKNYKKQSNISAS